MDAKSPQVRAGMDVYSADGVHVGIVTKAGPNGFVVDRLRGLALVVPENAVQTIQEGRVTLAVDDNQIDSQSWPSGPDTSPLENVNPVGGGIDRDQIRPGMTVVGLDFAPVGTISEVRDQDFLVSRPFLPDLFMPLTVVTGIANHQAVLNVRADQVEGIGQLEPLRTGEATSTDAAGQARTGMNVYGSDGVLIGRISAIADIGCQLREPDGRQYWIPYTIIGTFEPAQQRFFLTVPAAEAPNVAQAAGPTRRATEGLGSIRDRIMMGTYVRTSDNAAIGRVKQVGDDRILVDRPLQRDLYVPFGAIEHIDDHDDTVFLDVSSDRVDDMNWPSPPLTEPPS